MTDRQEQKAIVLLSGGMDSTTSLAIALEKGFLPFVLHLNYGQRTEKRELQSFEDICSHYQIPKERQLIIDISHLKKIGGSALTNKEAKLKTDGTLSSDDEIPASYVPFRNAHILSIAVSWAEVVGANSLFIGAVQEDSSGYPDCREEFIKSFEQTANLGTKPETHIEIKAPLLHMTKSEIVKESLKFGAPLSLTWSCYDQEDSPCQKCESCLLRARGFHQAQTADPLLKGVSKED